MNNIPSISNSELEVMKFIWKSNPITSDEIISELSQKMNWNPQTIKTFITRLVKKGAIGYNKSGRNYLYYPIVTHKKYIMTENKSFLRRVYNGAIDRLFCNFIDQENLTKEDIERIQKLLEDKKKENSQK
ncbi:MAG: BlaI/MecI/CopY family transcriptional regulator [Anaeromicrobium sp.]|jgi:BlaI family penicillinase repressor|uniref:BlaI/MecI/CopY family transcriptional regulator n=1 Tax=Anaeromicrobium sp. TaxID=1929132 RepID=UPI0025D3BA78|nr:BlaI/MecI/CopY family transcriptional regulator [Anaeromicrobium sp.]MCT4593464.1 BlaI/MecI/CopY family transcriptional regulator [Anaeromicrobium sp.]